MMQDRKSKRTPSSKKKSTQKADMIGQAMREAFDRTSQEPLPKRLEDLMEDLKKKEQENKGDKSD